MTIAAAYLTPEGVVFGTDSATTYRVLPNPPTVVPIVGQQVTNALKPYFHAQKLFEVGEKGKSRVALCTWGDAIFGTVSHRAIAAKLSDWMIEEEKASRPPSISAVVAQLIALVQGAAQGRPGSVGYFIGGWEPITHIPKCYSLGFLNGIIQQQIELAIGQAQFNGVPAYFTRVFHGYDESLFPAMLAKLQERLGTTVADVATIFEECKQAGIQAIPKGMFPMLPIREAIDFIHMHLHLTIKSSKFFTGPTTCGGPIEIGFISVDRPFRWVRHKNFESAILETELGEKGEIL